MHGKRWHRALSQAVGTEESTLRRWIIGQNNPRDEMSVLRKLAPALTTLSSRPITVEWLLDPKDNEIPPIVSAIATGDLSALELRAEASIGSLPVAEGDLARAMLDPAFVQIAKMLLAVYRRAERPPPR